MPDVCRCPRGHDLEGEPLPGPDGACPVCGGAVDSPFLIARTDAVTAATLLPAEPATVPPGPRAGLDPVTASLANPPPVRRPGRPRPATAETAGDGGPAAAPPDDLTLLPGYDILGEL